MALTPDQRAALETLGDFTEDTFLQPHYAGMLLPKLRELRDGGHPLTQDDAIQWAREREWSDLYAGMLGGIAWSVRYYDKPL